MTTKPTFPSTWPGLMPQDPERYAAALTGDPAQQAAIVAGLQNAAPYQYPSEAYRNVYAEPVRPRQRAQLLNPNWKYTHSSETDVRKTWARFGWQPTKRSTK